MHEFLPNRMLTERDIRNQMDVSVRFVQWKFLNMLKTSHRTERTSPDIAEQGADSQDKKQT